MSEITSRIKDIRKLSGLSQKNFAESIGIYQGYLSKIENGKVSISERIIDSICKEFDVREEWLRDGKGEMSNREGVSPGAVRDFELQMTRTQNMLFSKIMDNDADLIKGLRDTLSEQLDRNKNHLKPVPVLMTAKNNLEDTLMNFLSMLREMFDPKNKDS